MRLVLSNSKLQFFVLFFFYICKVQAGFVHPGGVHTLDDLNRMKEKVNAQISPWVDAYNLLINNSKAQNYYKASPAVNVGGTVRQQAARDATAAYYNMLRWYISGDASYANCAIGILNAWSSKVNAVVSGELFQIPVMMFVQAAELARGYPGWAAVDIQRFRSMCLNYFYPACHDFLVNDKCAGWASWGMPAVCSVLYIGIFCDDQAKFDEAV